MHEFGGTGVLMVAKTFAHPSKNTSKALMIALLEVGILKVFISNSIGPI
jgi:hypothetical protein